MKAIEHDQPAKILIVDDEPQITRVLRTALSTQGYSLQIAANGVEGMEAIHAWKPDLVITDVSMPQMNGEEVLRHLRQLRPDVRVIVMSGYNEHEMQQRFAGQRVAGFVQKPFGPAVLLATPQTDFLLDGVTRVGLKMLLNALSTCTMVQLGRVMGNCMVWVVPSNLKLIDRSTRPLQLTPLGQVYYDGCKVLTGDLNKTSEREKDATNDNCPICRSACGYCGHQHRSRQSKLLRESQG